MKKPRTFQHLATKAHNMNMIVANLHGNSFFIESKEDKVKCDKIVKLSKNLTKESISISTGEAISIMGMFKSEDKKRTPFKEVIKKHPILKGL